MGKLKEMSGSDAGSFGQGGDPVVTSKDMENKDGMLASPSSTYPAGAAKGGGAPNTSGGRLGK